VGVSDLLNEKARDYVRRKLIASGELDDDWLPTHWSPEWAAQVLAVLAIC